VVIMMPRYMVARTPLNLSHTYFLMFYMMEIGLPFYDSPWIDHNLMASWFMPLIVIFTEWRWFQCKLCTKARSLFASQIELDWRFFCGFLYENLSMSKIKIVLISTITAFLFNYFGMTLPYFCCIYSSVCMNAHF
jgi:hypothetical protein